MKYYLLGGYALLSFISLPLLGWLFFAASFLCIGAFIFLTLFSEIPRSELKASENQKMKWALGGSTAFAFFLGGSWVLGILGVLAFIAYNDKTRTLIQGAKLKNRQTNSNTMENENY